MNSPGCDGVWIRGRYGGLLGSSCFAGGVIIRGGGECAGRRLGTPDGETRAYWLLAALPKLGTNPSATLTTAVVPGFSIDVLPSVNCAWILAFARMTRSGCRPAGAGTPRYEKARVVVWHGGFCRATPRPQRGTSPSPREVFDRGTLTTVVVADSSIDVLPRGYGAWIPVYTGMTRLGAVRPVGICRGPTQGDSRIAPTETVEVGGPAGRRRHTEV